MWLTMWIISTSSGSTIGPFWRSSSSNLIPCLSKSSWEGREGSIVSRRAGDDETGVRDIVKRKREDTHTHIGLPSNHYTSASANGAVDENTHHPFLMHTPPLLLDMVSTWPRLAPPWFVGEQRTGRRGSKSRHLGTSGNQIHRQTALTQTSSAPYSQTVMCSKQ